MQKRRALRQVTTRVASLLAVLALVLALLSPARIGIDPAFAAAHALIDCADHHAIGHDAMHHGADVYKASGHSHAHADHAQAPAQQDQTPHYHTHPCCMGTVAVVLPAFDAMRAPIAIGGHRVVGDTPTRLERRSPEGPNEPPRTVDMA